MNYQGQICCPKCGSNQISANKRGWTLTTGMIGSNKVLITCLNCGKQFKPGAKPQPKASPEATAIGCGVVIVIIGLIVLIAKCSGGSENKADTSMQMIDTTVKHDTSARANKPIGEPPNIKYEIVHERKDVTGETYIVYVYIRSKKSINKLNTYLINQYTNRSPAGFQIYYFNDKEIAQDYEDEVFNGDNSDEKIERLSTHIIARYEDDRVDAPKLMVGKEAQE
jgi:hypothetical protein